MFFCLAHSSVLGAHNHCDQIENAIQRLLQLEKKHVEKIQHQSGLIEFKYLGLPDHFNIRKLDTDEFFYHYTDNESADIIMQKKKITVGKDPYVYIIPAGSSTLYMTYMDLTGIQLIKNFVDLKKVGVLQADKKTHVFQVEVPKGYSVIEVLSSESNRLFHFIPLSKGYALPLDAKLIQYPGMKNSQMTLKMDF